jgi:ferric-dicitrate binding protein FerR (iron transport regulator)
MGNLINKYRKDELTTEELFELRKDVNSMTDEEVEQQFHSVWRDEDMDMSSVDTALIDKIKSNIDAVIGRKRSGISLFIRWSQIAAAVLLPIAILSAVYFYRENSLILSEEMFVTTGKSERATITLPDGTTVSLNTESKLGYLPKNYNKKERKINFSGEGYFQVRQNQEVPFYIQAKGLQVKVLGTVFNLRVREEAATAELSLEEGSVWLSANLTNKSVILHENQKAVLDQSTGDIIIFTDENIKDISGWRRGDMIFRNTQLSQVIRILEENYAVTIKVNCSQCLTDEFTGTLPINDLNEALDVIERCYHLKAVMNGK